MQRVDHSGPTRVARRLASATALLAVASATGAADEAKPACPDAPEAFATVADVSDDLSIVLSDGRKLRLSGVEPPRTTAHAPSRSQELRDALRARLRDTTIGLAPLGAPDRWQTIPAVVFTEDGMLALSLLSRGLVRMQPDRAAAGCRESLRRSELEGRQVAGGVWSDPSLAPIDADAIAPYGTPPADLLEGLVIVEGKVASVGDTPSRLYLNLGHRRGGFAISLPKRDSALMASDAIRRARIVGTRLRVRGLIDRHTGLRIDVSDADAIEILGSEPGDAVSPTP